MDRIILRIGNSKYIVLIILIILNLNTLALAADDEGSFLEKQQAFTKKDFEISPAEFRVHLQGISEFGAGTIEKAGDNIIALSDDPTVKKNALMWKMTSIPIIYKIFSYPKPLKAGIDIWAFCIQMKQYFQSVDSQKAFGKLNLIGFEAAAQIESKMVQLAKLMSRNGEISNAKSFVESWAIDNPIQIPLFVRTSIIPVLSSGIGDETLGTFEAVGELSSQIDDITNMLTLYGNHIPKQARWQAEILLSDLGTSEAIDILLAEVVKVSEVMQQVGKVIELLPDLIVSERTALLETIRNERLETLNFMSSERHVVIEALQNERKMILDSLDNERRAIVNDIKLIENDIIQNAIKILNKSIDHFFWRATQLVGACLILILIVGFIGVYFVIKKRPVA